MNAPNIQKRPQALSTELAGGAGFTYEDTVVAYYLSALLRKELAAGQDGIVVSVAVQQAGHGHPMDDLIVEFADSVGQRTLGLQIKRQLTISAAASNDDFRSVMATSVTTFERPDFRRDSDAFGFVVERVNDSRFRSLSRLIEWAKSSPDDGHFRERFDPGGSAAADERALRDELLPLIGAIVPERAFYRHFVALHFNGLSDGAPFRMECVNRLQEIVADNLDGQGLLLFDRLARLAREGSGSACKWTRESLLTQLRGAVQLRVIPNLESEIDALTAFSFEGLGEISESIDETHIARPALQAKIAEQVAAKRLINISGLPGCGKSAVLKHFATETASRGTILFLKSDRLHGTGWSGFAAALGLKHSCAEILAEIGATGSPILFIDGIDRIRPDHKAIVTDILHTIESRPDLNDWKVVATSRDQGLEPYRAWFPSSFYRDAGIGDISVDPFSDEEATALAAEKPHLKRLLFGAPAVQEIARRPFFAAVLARGPAAEGSAPQTEIDLISEWWARAGHDSLPDAAVMRQRALLDLAESGVRNLGKGISSRKLKDATFPQITSLKADLLIREHDGGASHSFTHDIFFEWTFFRLLIELGANWYSALIEAGEPPLLGRVVGLLAQNNLLTPGKWTSAYRQLATLPLRAQWRRDWLTAPPFSTAFPNVENEFQVLLSENDWALLEKLLVWFQAQHSIPSPVMLARTTTSIVGIDLIRVADLLGWPSDFQSWGRLLDWLLPRLSTLPTRLIPQFLELFAVWQNALAELPNTRSKFALEQCSAWLIELEGVYYNDRSGIAGERWGGLGSEARKNLASSLRSAIIRSAKSYPSFAEAIYTRATTNEDMRRDAYSDLAAFTPTMAAVNADLVAAVAEAELIEELPQEKHERQERERRESHARRERLRKTPEAERTPEQSRALTSGFFPIIPERYEVDEIGIDRHHSYYHPPSALHEPFASLFAQKPSVALRLVKNLANRATTGWRQVHDLERRHGTPLPVTVKFPWCDQMFWGDWRIYSWSQGQLAPQPLECAFSALAYWAFQQLEGGRPAGEIIRDIVEGCECYAMLGLALQIALESFEVSDVTLPIVCCQRLWPHDMARLAQEPMKGIDLFGLGLLMRLSGAKQKAKEFLDQRRSRSREIRQLAMLFAHSDNERLRAQLKESLKSFPDDLPFMLEEEKTHPEHVADLKESAERWSGLGDVENYKQTPTTDDAVIVTYESPAPLSEATEQRLAENIKYLHAQSMLAWAMKSLSENAQQQGMTLERAVAFAKLLDSQLLFDKRLDVGGHASQSAVSAIAACVIRFDYEVEADREWAWDVMSRVQTMSEPEGFRGSQIPWHPGIHLVVALVHDRRSAAPKKDSARRLLDLAGHRLDSVSHVAFSGAFTDQDENFRWIAGRLAADLSIYRRPIYNEGEYDNSLNDGVRAESFRRALNDLEAPCRSPLLYMPPAWAKISRRRRSGESEESWGNPELLFDSQFAAKIFAKFPIEAWCQSVTFRPMLEVALKQMVDWTAERVMPPWREEKSRQDRQTDLYEWKAELGDLLSRAAPYLDTAWFRENLLKAFLVDDEEMLSVLAAFAGRTVTRQILDAPTVPGSSIALLGNCVERVLSDRTFRPNNYRAGEVYGHDIPNLIRALLFVSVEDAPGASRFANKDWQQIGLVMPIISRLISTIGWSTFVMGNYLTLCERAGLAFPLDDFAAQTQAVLASLLKAKGSWAGTTLPARIAGVVQRQADGNYPLRLDQAQALLQILDALIDLGDRRSAALEQTEAFKSVQGTGSI